MDSNWTEPWLFIIYSIVKPIAAVFILVLMYVVFAAIGNVRPQPLFDFMYVGNAFFIFVGSTLFGTFQVIQSDREWYQTIDRKSTRLNSSHITISYAVFCL